MIADTRSLQRGIKEIVLQATKLWLDLGVQRCRIVIVIPQASRGANSSRQIRLCQDLVLQPEVQRKGNAKGENLDMPEVEVCRLETFSLGAM